MTKLTYWQKRMLQVALARTKKDLSYIEDLNERYDVLSNAIEKEIRQWVKKYAINEDMTSEDAYKLLSKEDQRNWSMTLKEFRQKAKDGGYDQELNREYFKSRISRLDQLKAQLYFELVEMAEQEEGYMRKHLEEQLNDSYLRSIYEITDRASFSLSFDRYDSAALEIAISKPWKGGNFSSRVWGNHTKMLPEKLSKTLAQAKLLGWGVDKTVKVMMTGVDDSLRNRMITLVQTESAHLSEVASDRAMAMTGVEKWQWLATLEIHTCEICGERDGKVYEVDDKDAPTCPEHPNCRCTRAPYVLDWQPLKRWRRDPVTGKGALDDYMTFEQWRESIEV